MTKDTPGLDAAYALETPDDNRRLYANWADSYDTSFAEAMRYDLPRHVAEAFAGSGGSGPVLDVGAGTGLVAAHLAAMGFGPIDATDISPEMLEVARGKGLYRDLFESDVTQAMDVPDGRYAGIVSAGTFTLGHVGPEALDELLRIAAPGAQFAIAVNAAHFEAAGFAKAFAALEGAIIEVALRRVPIYGTGAAGDHAADEGLIALFRKAG